MERAFANLLDVASGLVDRCHCPYSDFHVTAVLEDSSGKLHCGVNVENASLGLTLCAERSALVSAVSSGSMEFRRLLVHSPDGEPVPCGACREVLAEFCPEKFPIMISGPGGNRIMTLGELLPERFSPGPCPRGSS